MSEGVYGTTIPKRRPRPVPLTEQQEDHEKIVRSYESSMRIRNQAERTVRSTGHTLGNFFAATGKFCWEVTTDDVREYFEDLVDIGLTPETRRKYISSIRLFYEYLVAHPWIPALSMADSLDQDAVLVASKYGTRVTQPVDRWFLPRHTSDMSPQRAIPSVDQLRSFFKFLRRQIDALQKSAPAARDYAFFRLLYNTGLRLHEACGLDVDDVRFDLGTIHVRYGKGSRGSGPRERYVPLSFGGLDTVIEIYLKQVRSQFHGAVSEKALFLSEAGRRINEATMQNRIVDYVNEAQRLGFSVPVFRCHDLRRAFATHLYEKHPEALDTIRQLLGHSWLSTTQRYVRPSAVFLQQQLETITGQRIARIMEDVQDD